MTNRVKVTFYPSEKSIEVRRGTTLLDASRKAGIPLTVRCGGKAACLMCKVKVTENSEVSAPGLNEKQKLGELTKQGFRLACQTQALGETHAEVPEDPLKAAVRKKLLQQQEDDSLW